MFEYSRLQSESLKPVLEPPRTFMQGWCRREQQQRRIHQTTTVAYYYAVWIAGHRSSREREGSKSKKKRSSFSRRKSESSVCGRCLGFCLLFHHSNEYNAGRRGYLLLILFSSPVSEVSAARKQHRRRRQKAPASGTTRWSINRSILLITILLQERASLSPPIQQQTHRTRKLTRSKENLSPKFPRHPNRTSIRCTRPAFRVAK